MTEREGGAMSTEHPDEGTIHAWLDGALGDVESARLVAHITGCAACTRTVAEARGLIAGASRVVRALDDESAGTAVPTWGDAARAALPAESSTWRALRVTPARAAIAATLLVVAGLTLTHGRTGQERVLEPPRTVAATSPVTGRAYPMTCTGNQPVTCRGGNGAVVYLYGGAATFG